MRGAVRNDVVWCDAVRCGAIRYGVVHDAGARSGTMSVHGALRCDAVRCGGSCGGGGRKGYPHLRSLGEDVDLVAAPCLRKGWDGM